MATVSLWTVCHQVRPYKERASLPEHDLCTDCLKAWDCLSTMLGISRTHSEDASTDQEELLNWGNAFAVISSLNIGDTVNLEELISLSERYNSVCGSESFSPVASSFGFGEEVIKESQRLIDRGLMFARMSNRWRERIDMWFLHIRTVKPDINVETQYELARGIAQFFGDLVVDPADLRRHVHFMGKQFEELFGVPMMEFCKK